MLKNNYVRIAIVIVLLLVLYYLVVTLARGVSEEETGSFESQPDIARLVAASSAGAAIGVRA